MGGVGKSVMSTLFHTNLYENIVAYHYCVHNKGPEFRDPRSIVLSIIDQLCVRLPDFKMALDEPARLDKLGELLSNPHFNAIELWNRFLVDPLVACEQERRYGASGRSFCILIDALDESGNTADPDNNDLLFILESCLEKLPSWMKILVTGRPEQHLKERLSKSFHVHVVSPDSEANRADVKNYVTAVVSPFVHADRREAAAALICKKCDYLFLSAKLMLTEQGQYLVFVTLRCVTLVSALFLFIKTALLFSFLYV